MLFWLLDNANFFYFLLATIALALCVYGWLTTRTRYVAYGLIPVGLIVLLWLLIPGPSDDATLARRLRGVGTAAAGSGRVRGLVLTDSRVGS